MYVYTVQMKRPELRIDPDSPVPAVRQITANLLVLLVEGHLQPGDTLPSVRRVAIELGVHFNTVAEAYRQLASEGWLDLKHGRAACVLERNRPAASRTSVAEFRERLRQLTAQMRSEGISERSIAAELQSLAEVFSR